MSETDRHDIWARMMVQTRNFASRGNFFEAAARLGRISQEVDVALASETNAAEKVCLEGFAYRVGQELFQMNQDAEKVRDAAETRKQSRIDDAAEEMARPLPSGFD